MPRVTRRMALTGGANLMIVKPETAFGTQANSAVSFGIVGTGGRGVYVGTHMANDKNARLAAICDIYPDKIDQAKTKIPTADKARVYRDYKELLKQPDIDAVLISTPVFMHPEHFEVAVQADKHIYCEKPAGADVTGVKRLLRAGEKANKAKTMQFGFQQRFSPEYLKARDYLKTGRIGDMKLMITYWVVGGLPPGPFTSPYPPEEQKIRHWGRWTATSGGPIVEQDCHGVDILNWFVDDLHPAKAVGTGGLRFPVPYGDWKTDHHDVTFTYPNGVTGWLISIKHTADFRDVREQLYGSKAIIDVARSWFKLHGPSQGSRLSNADDLRDKSLIERQDTKREITIDATESFFRSILEKKPYHMWKSAAEGTFTAILARMAVDLKREVTWDEMLKSS